MKELLLSVGRRRLWSAVRQGRLAEQASVGRRKCWKTLYKGSLGLCVGDSEIHSTRRHSRVQLSCVRGTTVLWVWRCFLSAGGYLQQLKKTKKMKAGHLIEPT